MEAYSDSELEGLLRDTPEPRYTPVPMISTKAVNVSAGDM